MMNRISLSPALLAAVLLAASFNGFGQVATQTPAATPDAAQPGPAQQAPSLNISNEPEGKSRKQDKVVPSKDTKAAEKKAKKDNPLAGKDVALPDKQLYDKAMDAIKHGRYDVARLELQALLNTYPESEYMMRSKLAIADSWYKEGGTAAYTQAEQEYKDFITFFPNVPEAAEAQMRVGDIYFHEMDRPDRDDSKALHAEEEYRTFLQQFPESTLQPQVQQRLREVQEALATREADIGTFYSTHQNWPATIARYQTVLDTYPLYSHMDDVLIGLGDAYEAEARYFRTVPNLPEGPRARLEKLYDDRAADAYRRVILEHNAAPHAEDARDRLAAMNLPIPTPTAAQVAASAALENSRGQYTLSNRVSVFLLHKADTVPAATIGNPPLENAKTTTAPSVIKQSLTDFNAAFAKAPAPIGPAAPAAGSTIPETSAAAEAPTPAAPAQPLALQDVPTATGNASSSSVISNVPNSVPSAGAVSGSGLGAEIVAPNANTPAPPVTPPAVAPAFPGTAPAGGTAAPASPAKTETLGGLHAVGPDTAAPLPPIEKAAPALDPINTVTPGAQTAAAQPANGKKQKVDCDKSDESCSRHKKKKGLAKLNPF